VKRPAVAPVAPAPEEGGAQVSDATLREFIGYHMKRAFNAVQADLNQTLKPLDLRMVTYSALVLIVDNPGLRQSQLAEARDIERANLVVIVDELEGRDLITRDRVPTDRRAYALNPTLAGRRLCARAVEAVRCHERRMLGGMEEETKQAVIRAMSLIRRGSEGGSKGG
jgi:DNA-binding MarR family transcriptional regulator